MLCIKTKTVKPKKYKFDYKQFQKVKNTDSDSIIHICAHDKEIVLSHFKHDSKNAKNIGATLRNLMVKQEKPTLARTFLSRSNSFDARKKHVQDQLSLTEEEWARILESGEKRHYEANQVIIQKGQLNFEVFQIVQGEFLYHSLNIF